LEREHLTVTKIQTKREIQEMLAAAGIRPRRRWGQNFLIDGNLMRTILDSADIAKDDVVLEVGTGTGALTEHLVQRAGHVVAAEIDPKLFDIVSDRIGHDRRFEFILGDVLSSKHHIADTVIDALRSARGTFAGRMMLVANLPYNVATPLLINLLLSNLGFDRYCFTVQREMADRFLATPDTRDFGPIAILSQITCDVRRLAILPPSVFWPSPQVDSAIVMMRAKRHPFESGDRLLRFVELLRGGFAHRRKTLQFNLARSIGRPACEALASDHDLSRRAEAVPMAEWVDIGLAVLADRD
jgi:16S rRNA (adenine1518-N6/adenine1519-N6)-dimethyltransferase